MSQVVLWLIFVLCAIGMACYLQVVVTGRPIDRDGSTKVVPASTVRWKSLLPLSFFLLFVCKAARQALGVETGSVSADLLMAGTVLALVGIVAGLLGRLWLFWSARRAGTESQSVPSIATESRSAGQPS